MKESRKKSPRTLQSFAKKYTPITDIGELRGYLQDAITLEFATIPPYLTACYSMKDAGAGAYQLTRDVVFQEMFHVYQAANLLIAVGGEPKFTDAHTPTYPTFIPNGDPDTTPYISPGQATDARYRDVFMNIERPAPFDAPPENENIQTIAQFYRAIWDGIKCLEKEAKASGGTIFGNTPGYTQPQDFYLGKGSGYVIEVSDLLTAGVAIYQIVAQGEGKTESDTYTVLLEDIVRLGNADDGADAGQPGAASTDKDILRRIIRKRQIEKKGYVIDSREYRLEHKFDWGAYNHYGARTDGEYGPILGLPEESSHYFKFKEIADGKTPLPDTYPIISVPDVEDYQNPNAIALSRIFDGYYSVLLRILESAAFSDNENYRNLYFETAMPLMHGVLPALAKALMQTPIWLDGNANVGPNASPVWEYRKWDAWQAICEKLEDWLGKRDEDCDCDCGDSPCESDGSLEGIICETRCLIGTIEGNLESPNLNLEQTGRQRTLLGTLQGVLAQAEDMYNLSRRIGCPV